MATAGACCRRVRKREGKKEKDGLMEWRGSYLDLLLIPTSLFLSLAYHIWLWRKIHTAPRSTIIGINSAGRRQWVVSIMEDNDKKNILAVQTIRNSIMASTLMATTSILICCGLGAVISSTYSVKKPINDSIYGARGEFIVAVKYATILFLFIVSFVCYSLSIRFINQANFLLNVPVGIFVGDSSSLSITPGYVSDILEQGFALNTVGNRIFFAAIPLLLWIFGPALVFLTSVSLLPILYYLDVFEAADGKGGRQNGVNAGEKSFV